VISGSAKVKAAGEELVVSRGGVAVIPADVPHEVQSLNETETLRFVATYAQPEVRTTYREPVEPGGSRVRVAAE
jgi:mannose-6-phosphate isomerase-like protein (cupin superfamily)